MIKNNHDTSGKFSRRKLISIGAALACLGMAGSFIYKHFSSTSPVKVESFITEGSGKKKNILVITGSARSGGNSDLLARAFMDGARQAGHDVNIFKSGETPMASCRNCDGCWTLGRPCVIGDNYEQFWPVLEKAQMLVFCSPLYWYNFSGHIKCAMDRMYPYSRKNRQRDMRATEAMLIMCGESILPRSFAGAAESYRQILGLKGWRDRGRLFVTGAHEFGAMKDHSALAKAREMGLNA